mgnify:CR=1 FL=1
MNISRDIKIIEAILFASNEPVSEEDLKDKMIAILEISSNERQLMG